MNKFFFPKKLKEIFQGIFECVEQNGSMRKATHFYIEPDNTTLKGKKKINQIDCQLKG